jgi:hypothetical protein
VPLVRAFNNLDQYSEEGIAKAYQSKLVNSLLEGLIIEGTSPGRKH